MSAAPQGHGRHVMTDDLVPLVIDYCEGNLLVAALDLAAIVNRLGPATRAAVAAVLLDAGEDWRNRHDWQAFADEMTRGEHAFPDVTVARRDASIEAMRVRLLASLATVRPRVR